MTTDTDTVTPRSSDDLVAALAAMPEELGRLLDGQPAEALSRPARDGGWGVVEILPHLRDWEEISRDRIRTILTEDHPTLPSYDDELWVIERDYRGQEPRFTLDHFRRLREEVVGMVRGLPADAWDRTAEHEVHGPITLRWLVDRITTHDADRLEQLRDALA